MTRLTQELVHRARDQVLAARSTFSIGLDAFGSTIHDNAPDSRFVAWLGQFQWVRRFGERGHQIHFRANGQVVDDSLLPLEQYSVGGLDSVRGFRTNQLVRDYGYTASLEYRLAGVRESHRAGATCSSRRSWIPAPRRTAPGPNPEPSRLTGIGLGLVWNLGPSYFAEIYFADGRTDVPEQPGHSLQDDGVHFRFVAFPMRPVASGSSLAVEGRGFAQADLLEQRRALLAQPRVGRVGADLLRKLVDRVVPDAVAHAQSAARDALDRAPPATTSLERCAGLLTTATNHWYSTPGLQRDAVVAEPQGMHAFRDRRLQRDLERRRHRILERLGGGERELDRGVQGLGHVPVHGRLVARGKAGLVRREHAHRQGLGCRCCACRRRRASRARRAAAACRTTRRALRRPAFPRPPGRQGPAGRRPQHALPAPRGRLRSDGQGGSH